MTRVLLLSFIVLFSSCSFSSDYPVHLYLTQAGKIKKGDEVKAAGIIVGKVQELKLHESGVIVTLDINKEIQIPVNSQFVLKSNADLKDILFEALGMTEPEVFVDVKMGNDRSNFIKANDTLDAVDKSDFFSSITDGMESQIILTNPHQSLNKSSQDFTSEGKQSEIDAIEQRLEGIEQDVQEVLNDSIE